MVLTGYMMNVFVEHADEQTGLYKSERYSCAAKDGGHSVGHPVKMLWGQLC